MIQLRYFVFVVEFIITLFFVFSFSITSCFTWYTWCICCIWYTCSVNCLNPHNMNILYISYNWKYITITFCYTCTYCYSCCCLLHLLHIVQCYNVLHVLQVGVGGYTLLQAGIAHRKTENPSSRMCLLHNIFSKIPLLVNNFRLCSLYLATIVRPPQNIIFPNPSCCEILHLKTRSYE